MPLSYTITQDRPTYSFWLEADQQLLIETRSGNVVVASPDGEDILIANRSKVYGAYGSRTEIVMRTGPLTVADVSIDVGSLAKADYREAAAVPVVLVGGSRVQRNFVWKDATTNQAQRIGRYVFWYETNHGVTPQQWCALVSRNLNAYCSRQWPDVIDANTLRFVADNPVGTDGFFATDLENLVVLQKLGHADANGGWIHYAATILGYPIKVVDMVAQGGDNTGQVVAKLDKIQAAARRVRKGGFVVGNVGSVVTAWTNADNPQGLQLLRAITDTGAVFLNTEVDAPDSSAGVTNELQRAAQSLMARSIDDESLVSGLVRRVPLFEDLVDRTNVNGVSRDGLHVDVPHYNQRGRIEVGASFADVIAPLVNIRPEVLSGFIGDVWTSNDEAIRGSNIAPGLWTGGSAPVALSTAGLVTGGSGATAGTIDPVFRVARTMACDLASDQIACANNRRPQRLQMTAGAAGSVELSLVGLTGSQMWRQARAGHGYWIAVWAAIDAIPGQTAPVSVSAWEIFCDTGANTSRLGAARSHESPEYASLPTTANVQIAEGGVYFFPELCYVPLGFADLRIVMRTTFSAAGSALVTFGATIMERRV